MGIEDSRTPSVIDPVSLIFFNVPLRACADAGQATATQQSRARKRQGVFICTPVIGAFAARCVTPCRSWYAITAGTTRWPRRLRRPATG